jgi:hypothetical protein
LTSSFIVEAGETMAFYSSSNKHFLDWQFQSKKPRKKVDKF